MSNQRPAVVLAEGSCSANARAPRALSFRIVRRNDSPGLELLYHDSAWVRDGWLSALNECDVARCGIDWLLRVWDEARPFESRAHEAKADGAPK